MINQIWRIFFRMENFRQDVLHSDVPSKAGLYNQAIESKMDKFTERISCKMDRIADTLDTLISNQSTLIAMIGNTPSVMQTNPLHPFQSSAAQIPHAYQQQYFPSLHPFYQ